MTNNVRSSKVLKKILEEKVDFSYTKKLRLAIEYYISTLPKEEQISAWQKLPYLVQFGPILVKYGKEIPDIRRVNPGIKYGGLTEYDKTAIYDKIPKSFALISKNIDEKSMPSFSKIEEILQDFTFPLMVKSQSGERGLGVYYMENKKALQSHREKMKKNEILREPCTFQEFCDFKKEYCLQFYQYYDQAGIYRVLSGGLTIREMPFVTGDGTHTVKNMITKLLISLAQKKKIINTLKTIKPKLLDKIPAKGEVIQIVYIASIDYGTVYKKINLSSTQQKQCETLIKNLLEKIKTNYISVGRFDLKANSIEELLSGKVKVIECNAGGGIPTHVYSEELTIVEKYEELEKHFNIMKNIAHVNKSKHTGFSPNFVARPEFLYISYKSISKKGLKVFQYKNPQKKELQKIYRQIFKILRIGRLSRWNNRFRLWFTK